MEAGKGLTVKGTTLGNVDRRPTHWTLSDSQGGFLVRINCQDGTLEYGPNYTPDEAAKRFWEAIACLSPWVNKRQPEQ